MRESIKGNGSFFELCHLLGQQQALCSSALQPAQVRVAVLEDLCIHTRCASAATQSSALLSGDFSVWPPTSGPQSYHCRSLRRALAGGPEFHNECWRAAECVSCAPETRQGARPRAFRTLHFRCGDPPCDVAACPRWADSCAHAYGATAHGGAVRKAWLVRGAVYIARRSHAHCTSGSWGSWCRSSCNTQVGSVIKSWRLTALRREDEPLQGFGAQRGWHR